MESKKVKVIKKALGCWQESIMLSTDENYVSHKVYNREILDYINELESARDNLYNLNQNLISDKQVLLGDMEKLKDKNERLEKEKEETMKAWLADREGMFWDGVGEGELKGYKQLKQFVERLREKMCLNENGYIEFLSGKYAIAIDIVDFENCLDKTLKEFTK